MESSVSHRVYQPTGLLGWISTAIEHPRAARMVQRSWKPPSSAQLGSDGFWSWKALPGREHRPRGSQWIMSFRKFYCFTIYRCSFQMFTPQKIFVFLMDDFCWTYKHWGFVGVKRRASSDCGCSSGNCRRDKNREVNVNDRKTINILHFSRHTDDLMAQLHFANPFVNKIAQSQLQSFLGEYTHYIEERIHFGTILWEQKGGNCWISARHREVIDSLWVQLAPAAPSQELLSKPAEWKIDLIAETRRIQTRRENIKIESPNKQTQNDIFLAQKGFEKTFKFEIDV